MMLKLCFSNVRISFQLTKQIQEETEAREEMERYRKEKSNG